MNDNTPYRDEVVNDEDRHEKKDYLDYLSRLVDIAKRSVAQHGKLEKHLYKENNGLSEGIIDGLMNIAQNKQEDNKDKVFADALLFIIVLLLHPDLTAKDYSPYHENI
ncbi:MAG: hypothetical protein GX421_00485 [Caldisericales bacterium]|nr:hypothetical protein [Caldisericales bacterium]